MASANAVSGQPAIDVEKYTNGQDADTAPGPAVIVGSPISWTYIVTNTSARPLTNISVTDDQGVVVVCPGTTLDAGVSFTCTGSGTAIAGQYANVGTVTATLPDTSIASDSDPSHYFGQSAPVVSIEKSTEGHDANLPPGPYLPAGSTVNWTYRVTNLSTSENLIGIVVTDDRGVSVSCPGTTLSPGGSMSCTGSGIVQPGQYSNIGSVTATTSPGGEGVAASDPSHYYGQMLRITKRTNGIESALPPGPILVVGSPVIWTYEIVNPGPAAVSGVSVTDDQGVVVTCPQPTLAEAETMTCTANGTAQAGAYVNIGTVTAMLPAGGLVTASDSSHYFGNPVRIEKATNGVDADDPPGPSVAVGSTVAWTYQVTNDGADTLTGIAVTDDQGVTVTCGSTTLAAGASMTCTASGPAVAGQYANVGTVDATSATYGTVSASDSSHYFGQTSVLDFGDAPDPPHLTLFASDGARHLLGSGIYLGACVDAEVDAPGGTGASGDDANIGSAFGTCAVAGDDEDGVAFNAPLVPGTTGSVTVVASGPCTLSAWIDFEADGDWADAGETLFPGGTALSAGANVLTFPVPSSAVAGTTYGRFRCTTDGAVAVTGQAGDGEVEDHQVSIAPATPSISATKLDSLVIDVDADNLADPGDTLSYTVSITNGGNVPATAVSFTDAPDANTSLVAGSVTTSAGVVTTGNTAGDTSVAILVGAIAPQETVTVTFRVSIDNPLPSGVTQVSNTGSVSGSNFTTVSTDDPSAPGNSDPTVTPVTSEALVTAIKTATLASDNNGNGIAEPGDRLRYTITITSSGNTSALDVELSDTPDSNTTIVPASVTASTGTITSGNAPGDTTVVVDIGTLAVAEEATITFDVTIDVLLPDVTSVTNSGTVEGSNFSPAATDSPSAPGNSDPTVFPVSAAATNIPTTDAWAMVAISLLLAIVALRNLGRH